MELGVTHILSVFLVVAGVGVIVLGFFKNVGRQVQKIKIERFGIDAELSTLGLWLVLGFLLAAGGVYLYLQAGAPSGPIAMRLNVHFEPDDVNPRNPQFNVKAFIKTSKGVEPIPILHKVSEGALSVRVNVPDMDTPFFIVFETPKGTWKTDDYSITEALATARKQELQ
ncbi:MAG: hypothetical protein ACREVH_10020 [Gammaproteobacteria bacterium]